MTELRQREAWVDWAKALLIYFVVIGHASHFGITPYLPFCRLQHFQTL